MTEKDAIKVIVPRFDKKKGFRTLSNYSEKMKKIRSSNTKPEVAFRKARWNIGIRFRLDNKGIFGKPDLAIKKYNLLIFIDGDFWHGYNWEIKKAKLKSNTNYWIPKIE